MHLMYQLCWHDNLSELLERFQERPQGVVFFATRGVNFRNKRLNLGELYDNLANLQG